MPFSATTETQNAVLMTNEMNQVVFVEGRILGLMGYSEAGVIIGEPLHKALGFGLDTANEILHQLVQTGELSQQTLELETSQGSSIHVSCTGVASYDHQGVFIGADLWLRWGQAAANEPNGPAGRIDDEAMALLEAYFLTRVEAIQAFLVMLGGRRFHNTLKNIINETAAQNDWPVHLKNGDVESDIRETVTSLERQAEIYAALMTKMLRYATRIAGAHRITREIEKLDAKTRPAALDLAQQLKLRQTIVKLLG